MLCALVGCMTDPGDPGDTSATEQHATQGHFPGAKMPAQPNWKGDQPPAPGPKQGYVVWMDKSGTYWNVLLADTSAGTIPYAVKVPAAKLGTFLSYVGAKGRIDVGRVPPPVGPTGGDWLARYGLELQLDVDGASARAMDLSY
ncbi:MAG: hypothetical protein ABI467_02195 [Kofleriaceae bacterium]